MLENKYLYNKIHIPLKLKDISTYEKSMLSLKQFEMDESDIRELKNIILGIRITCSEIYKYMRNETKSENINKYAHDNILSCLNNYDSIKNIILEEDVNIIEINQNGRYTIAIDPIDCSNDIDMFISCGTIFGIYLTHENKIGGNDLVAAGYCLYGNQTYFVSIIQNRSVQSYILNNDIWLLKSNDLKIPQEDKIYSINEAYSDSWDKCITFFIKELKRKNMKLRYTSSMVTDIHRILHKGGIFLYPANEKYKHGNLRYLYEVAPMSFIVKQAGGGAFETLDKHVYNIHQRYPCIIGNKNLIEEYEIISLNF